MLKNMDMKQVSIVVLLDMSKAFDSIRHNLLLSKLRKIDIGKSAFAWFESYLSMCTQVVRLQDTISTSLPLSVGVPQGSIFIHNICKRNPVGSQKLQIHGLC